MIGSYTNAMLYTLELVAAYIYYFASPRSSKDPIFLKCCVATSLVSDTVGTIGVCALAFIVSVPNTFISFFFFWRALRPTSSSPVCCWYGLAAKYWNLWSKDAITSRKVYWAFQMFIVSNIVSAFIFQSYMVYRLWKLWVRVNIMVDILILKLFKIPQLFRLHLHRPPDTRICLSLSLSLSSSLDHSCCFLFLVWNRYKPHCKQPGHHYQTGVPSREYWISCTRTVDYVSPSHISASGQIEYKSYVQSQLGYCYSNGCVYYHWTSLAAESFRALQSSEPAN